VEALGNQSFSEITIAPLTELAGVGYATFFRHYRDKNDLLADVAHALIRDLVAHTMPLFRSGDRQATAKALVARIQADRRLCRTLLSGAGEPIRALVMSLAVDAATAEGSAESRFPKELGAQLVVGAILTILTWWLNHQSDMQLEEVAELICRAALVPFSAAD
jgi:AcrR family transcriptional regulator